MTTIPVRLNNEWFYNNLKRTHPKSDELGNDNRYQIRKQCLKLHLYIFYHSYCPSCTRSSSCKFVV